MRLNGYYDGCAGKTPFHSAGEAHRHLRKRKSKVNTKGSRGGLRPYRCAVCKYWHIGAGQR